MYTHTHYIYIYMYAYIYIYIYIYTYMYIPPDASREAVAQQGEGLQEVFSPTQKYKAIDLRIQHASLVK